MDRLRVEGLAHWAARALLPAHGGGSQATGARGRRLRALCGRREARAEGGGRMNPREWLGRIAAFASRDRLNRELENEMREHRELLARDLEHEGMSRADA